MEKISQHLKNLGLPLLIFLMALVITVQPSYAADRNQLFYESYAQKTLPSQELKNIDTLILGDHSAANLTPEDWQKFFKTQSLTIPIEKANLNDLKATLQDFLRKKPLKELVLVVSYQMASESSTVPHNSFQINDYLSSPRKRYHHIEANMKHIGALNPYLKQHPLFREPKDKIKLDGIAFFRKNIKEIKKICKANQIKFTVIVPPLYENGAKNFSKEDRQNFYQALASITHFWDFSQSSINNDPRYFYTPFEARDSVGKMMLHRISENSKIKDYLPKDFGKLIKEITQNTIFLEEKVKTAPTETNLYTKKVPIIGFHHLANNDPYNVSAEKFKECLTLLKQEGYTTILPKNLEDYVTFGKELPDKPVMITFDDGYSSFYTIAFPILKEMNMKAVSYFIGSSLGKSTYKNSGDQIYPHYSINQGKEMYRSGLVDIQSHTFDMHQYWKFENHKEVRSSVLPLNNDTPERYALIFNSDFLKNNGIIKEITGDYTRSLAYPKGDYSSLTEALFIDKGLSSTLSVDPGINIAIKGLPQSLYAMKRFFPYPKISMGEIKSYLEMTP